MAVPLLRAGTPLGVIAVGRSIIGRFPDNQVTLLQTFADVPGVDRPVTLTRAGFKLAGADPLVASPPPRLGEHTDEVLRDIGYSDGDIERLRAAGAI